MAKTEETKKTPKETKAKTNKTTASEKKTAVKKDSAKKTSSSAAAKKPAKTDKKAKQPKQSRHLTAADGWKEKKEQIRDRGKQPKTLAERKALEDKGPVRLFFMKHKGKLPAKFAKKPAIRKKWKAVAEIVKRVAAAKR